MIALTRAFISGSRQVGHLRPRLDANVRRWVEVALGDAELDDPVDEHLFRYRGCAGLPSPAAQAVERMALAAAGWDVLDRPRRHTDLGGGRHRLEARGLGTWEAHVADGRRLPVPV